MAKTSYTPAELAAESGMSQDRVRSHCKSGDFGFQDGKAWIITHESFIKWLKQQDRQCHE